MNAAATNPPLWHRAVFGLAACLGGALLQWFRTLGLALLALRCRLAAGRVRRVSRCLGEAMYAAHVGDQRVLQRLESFDAPGAPLLQEEEVARQRERLQLHEQLGSHGLEASVPLLAVEQVYQGAAAVRAQQQSLERSRAALAARIWPASPGGWLTLLCSYALTIAIILFAVSRLSTPKEDAADQPILAVLHGRFGDVEVRVKTVKVTRVQFNSGEQVVMGDTADCVIVLEVSNVGSAPVQYRSWRGQDRAGERDFATLIDSQGVSVRGVHYRGGAVPQGGVVSPTLAPGATVEDVLVFVAPDVRSTHLDLFLPAGNVGAPAGTPSLKLTIPSDRIERPTGP